MTPEQLARVVDAGRNVAGSEMHAVLDAMHDELMAIEQDNAAEDLRKAAPPPRPRIARMAGNPLHIKDPTIVIEAGEKIIGGQRLRLSADGKQVFLADSVAPLLGIAVTDADPGWPVVVRELNEIEREAAKFAGIELKTPATDAGQPPEPGPFDRFIRGEFFNGPAHPDPYQGLQNCGLDPDAISDDIEDPGTGEPYPKFPPIAPETWADPLTLDHLRELYPGKIHQVHGPGTICWCGYGKKLTDAENHSRGEAAALLRENPPSAGGATMLREHAGPPGESHPRPRLSDARLTPGERMARRVGDRRRAYDAPESVPPLNGMPGGYPTEDQQEALRRISKAVAAGGDVIVTDDKPNPDAPVHGLQETMFYQDNNPEETDKPVAAVQHTADGKNHRVVVWFGEDGAAADQFAAWFNTNRVDPVDELLGNGGTPVAATRPQPVYDALARNHAFDPDPEMAQFCKCGHSRYHDVHVLAK